jgi:DNA processing protein
VTELSAEQRALLALTLVSGVGPRLIRALIARFGSAESALRAPATQLSQVPHVSERLAGQFRAALDALNVDEELERMRQLRVRLVFQQDPEYPPRLAQIKYPPPLLYVCGSIEPQDENAIAVVGSRHATAYGRRIAEQLAGGLARAGCTVVSGLARGIDAAAHRGALQAGGRTLAIMAGGLSAIYPPEHKELAEQITLAGALITEFNMRMEPLPVLFPMRNRIISGITRAVVVVEANRQSGALITAHHALEQNRDVFAIPGPVDSPTSGGTLQLLRDGARLIRNADDLLEDMRGLPAPTHRAEMLAATAGGSLFDRGEPGVAISSASQPPAELAPKEPPVELDELQRRIWEFLNGASRSPDDMVQELGVAASQLPGTLLMMEMKKVIRRLPGNRYERS